MATKPLDPTKATEAIVNAYDPDECESCELRGSTCWECSEGALEELAAKS